MAVVIVTGCSSGIGHSLCQEFAKAGCKVYATARRKESLQELAAEGLTVIELDVTKPESIKACVDTLMAKEGRIDILVNNAGVNVYGPIVELPMEDVRALFETNVFGLLAMTKAVAPIMMKQRAGKILNVGSTVGVVGTPFAGPYCASKASVEMISQALRIELEPFNVQVMNICPGGIVSKIAENGSKGIEKYKDGAWGPIYEAGILKRANTSQALGTPTAKFTSGVVREALKSRLRFEYWAGSGSTILRILGHIPTWITAWMFRRRYALDRLARIVRGQ